MTVPKCDGGEGSYVENTARGRNLARVQSGNDPEPMPCEQRGGEAMCSSQEAQRYRENGQPNG